MTRDHDPVAPALGPLAAFSYDLQLLRDAMGPNAPTIDEISQTSGVPRSTLYTALKGDRLPSKRVVAALVNAWQGDEDQWLRKRSAIRNQIADSRRRRPSQSLRDGSVWMTVPVTRTVVVVVTSGNALMRMLAVVSLLESDLRIQVVFTIDPNCAFTRGLSNQLFTLGLIEIPWHEAVSRKFDLIMSTRLNVSLDGPVLAQTSVDTIKTTGIPKTFNGRICIDNASDLQQVRAIAPELGDKTVVVGDPYFNQAMESRLFRNHYRKHLGLKGDDTLVLIASSWGPDSLLGKQTDLLTRLDSQLSDNHVQLALVLHPNVWAAHGTWQITAWMREVLKQGAILIAEQTGERAALLSADAVIGDHGAITFYAATMGLPTLTVGQGGPARGMRTGPENSLHYEQLDPDSDLKRQLETAIGSRSHKTPPTTYPSVARQGEEVVVLRSTIYRLLGIEQPRTPPRFPPVPQPTVIVVPHGIGYNKYIQRE